MLYYVECILLHHVPIEAVVYCILKNNRDVVLGLGPWSLVVLKDKIAVLGPGLGLEPLVLGPVLGLAC